MIVFGLFLVVVGVTTTAQTILASAHFSNAVLNEIVGSDAGTVRSFLNLNLLEDDLREGSTPARQETLANGLASVTRNSNLIHVEVRLPDGTVVASEDAGLVGSHAALSADFETAVAGTVAPTILQVGAPSEAGTTLSPPSVLREYFPVSSGGTLRAVVGVWRDAGPILRAMDDLRQAIIIVTVSGALVAAVFLFLVFRAAQARISRQTVLLMEGTRRDPLTGLLNHGALLTTLANRIERARTDVEPIGIALVDVDGFRLLNETYGHDAGDTALVQVAGGLAHEFQDVSVVGRYGPDEFLVIVDGHGVAALEPALERLRSVLAQEALEIEAPERVPVTVSAAIAVYPSDAGSVTGLLSTAVQTLAEAKASGGDAIRVAGLVPVPTADAKAFDVFQGLILAVDTKDRYTKRHCEDVSRHAVMLASRMGLDVQTIRTIRVAGLLHDIGKIGIPDAILRKPGKLTNDEFRAVKQHVALGDMILRDLPDIELIRAGVRHHHERWDGRGYLDELPGDEIPLIARILAVADAFSAMTTSRPYRKAYTFDEALLRLEDASGTQLDESLVKAFVDEMRTEVDTPHRTAVDPARASLWTPVDSVA